MPRCSASREFGSPTYEADDIIGTIATRLRAAGHALGRSSRATRISRSSIRDGDHYWDYAGERRFAYEDIEGQFGVRPERMADYLALTGDAVDNIPGVPGVGPKTAAALLAAFASLEEIYAGLDRGRSAAGARRGEARRDRLAQHREAAYLARQLTVIACDMPLEFSLDTLRRRKPDLDGARRFLRSPEIRPALRRQAERLAKGDCPFYSGANAPL